MRNAIPAYYFWLPALGLLGCAAVMFTAGENTAWFLTLQQQLTLLPDSLWANTTVLGDALVALALIALLALRHPEALHVGIVGGLFCSLIIRTVKPLLNAERPLAVLGEQVHVIGIELHNLSFPSGHTTSAFLLAGVYALILQRHWLVPFCFALASLIGLSRIAVGAHWPVDVCTGAAVGWLGAWVGWKLAPFWQSVQGIVGQSVLIMFFLLASLGLFFLNSGYPQAFWLQMGIASLSTFACLLMLWQQWQTFRHSTPP